VRNRGQETFGREAQLQFSRAVVSVVFSDSYTSFQYFCFLCKAFNSLKTRLVEIIFNF
jgi:hypothetical protein